MSTTPARSWCFHTCALDRACSMAKTKFSRSANSTAGTAPPAQRVQQAITSCSR
ncbi:MAG: hypothetical protein U0797_12395 [Gemmataceae bacterium]